MKIFLRKQRAAFQAIAKHMENCTISESPIFPLYNGAKFSHADTVTKSGETDKAVEVK